MTTVTILLSAYNGEKYLAQQLDSILAQDFQDWQLIIRDDNSEDSTLSIISDYMNFDNRVKLHKDMEGKLGANRSFRYLITIAPESNYYLFADQDDFWMTDKINSTVKILQTVILSKPALVYSDLYYCDENLTIKSNSYFKMLKASEHDVNYRYLTIENFIPGCSMGLNRALFNLIKPNFGLTMMYDYWMLLQACLHGEALYLANPTVKYRRHNNTATHSFSQKIKHSRENFNYCNNLSKRAQMILNEDLLLTTEQKKFFQEIESLSYMSCYHKLLLCFRCKFLPKNLLKKNENYL